MIPSASSGPLGALGLPIASQLIGDPLVVEDTGLTSSDHAELTIKSSGASGGDAIAHLQIGTASYANLGLDNSDSDVFKISEDSGGNPGTKTFYAHRRTIGTPGVDEWSDHYLYGGLLDANSYLQMQVKNNDVVLFANARLSVGGSGGLSYLNEQMGMGTISYDTNARLTISGTKTVASATGASWNALTLAASTLTLTGTTTVTRLNLVKLAAPTITDAEAVTVTDAATLYIAGPPAAGGSVTLTTTWALDGVGWFRFVAKESVTSYAKWVATDTVSQWIVGTTGTCAIDCTHASTGTARLIGDSGGIAVGSAGTEALQIRISNNEKARITNDGTLSIGETSPDASNALRVKAARTVASAGAAVWDGVHIADSTLTLTGTTTVDQLNFVKIGLPTLTDASAVTVTTAAALYLDGEPLQGGSVTISNSYALLCNGVARFNSRILAAAGDDIASGNQITLTNGNFANVTGTTEIRHINNAGWTAGSTFILRFTASVTVKSYYGSAAAGYGNIMLAGNADFNAAAYDILMLVFNGTNWHEVSRTVPGPYPL